MNDNREWKVSLEDALREIHRQLMEDEIYLNRRLSQGALPEELPDEEMRIRRIFSLAVMMEETIDNVLKEIESADAEEPAPEGELHSLEYKSHTIGTPDEETASADIEDIAIDDGPAEPANAPDGTEETPEAAEETVPADEEAPAAESAEAGGAAEADRTAEESGLTDAPEAEDTDAEEGEDAEAPDEWEDHDDEEEDDEEEDDDEDDEIPFMTDAGTSREALRAAAEKDRKEKKKKEKKEKERREKEKKKKKEKDKKDKKKDKKEKKKAKKEKKDKAGKKIKLVIED